MPPAARSPKPPCAPTASHPERANGAPQMTSRPRLAYSLCTAHPVRVLAAGLALSTASLGAVAPAAPAAASAAAPRAGTLRPACPAAPFGEARCLVLYRPQTSVNRAIAERVTGLAARPKGWGPRQLERAYRLPVNRRSHATVAISIAFDTPNLARYLAVYRKQFGLPACAVPSGCFRKVNENGKARPLPISGVRSGWDLEATLDVSMISAACPHCRILVVEANSPTFADLAKTEDTAARLGAPVISNSYGARENGFALHYAGRTTTPVMRSRCRPETSASPRPASRPNCAQLPQSAAPCSAGRTTGAAGQRRCGTSASPAPGAAVARPTWPSRRGSATGHARAVPSPTSPRSHGTSRSTTRTGA